MSDAERRLWQELRGRRFAGYKFRRQRPIGPFIADYSCIANRLIVECDGDSHGFDDRQLRDAARSAWLERNGWRVLRFWEHELQDRDNVLERIWNALTLPSPASGRGAA
ncbi:MAG TPA: endonuclease domain-containing protein [Candidatus Dormibacteraeota bacterium]|nr:endonuclease domain-containing protein [Candidatus Dormibacteraeota bacterium]